MTTYTHNGIELVWDGKPERYPRKGEYFWHSKTEGVQIASWDFTYRKHQILIPKQQAEKKMTTKEELKLELMTINHSLDGAREDIDEALKDIAKTQKQADELAKIIYALPDEPKEDAIKVGDLIRQGVWFCIAEETHLGQLERAPKYYQKVNNEALRAVLAEEVAKKGEE